MSKFQRGDRVIVVKPHSIQKCFGIVTFVNENSGVVTYTVVLDDGQTGGYYEADGYLYANETELVAKILERYEE